MPSRRTRLLAVVALGVALVQSASAEVFLSRKEAIAVAFPDADHVAERSVILDEAQTEAIEQLAKAKLESRIVKLYEGKKDGATLGWAFIDIHTVRTLPEAFLVVLNPDGSIRTLRVLAFYEPPEYQPPSRWLDQFETRALAPGLRLGGEIHGIAGSTLTSRAVVGGVRRSLALYEVLVRQTPLPVAATPDETDPGSTLAGGR